MCVNDEGFATLRRGVIAQEHSESGTGGSNAYGPSNNRVHLISDALPSASCGIAKQTRSAFQSTMRAEIKSVRNNLYHLFVLDRAF
jgi:hypothetical protein